MQKLFGEVLNRGRQIQRERERDGAEEEAGGVREGQREKVKKILAISVQVLIPGND